MNAFDKTVVGSKCCNTFVAGIVDGTRWLTLHCTAPALATFRHSRCCSSMHAADAAQVYHY